VKICTIILNHCVVLLVIYDITVNCIFPVVLMIFFNLTLIIRHIRQKQRVTQQIQWHKHRKMIFQLLSITILLLIFYLPICILMMINSIIFIFLCLFSCSPNAFCLFAVDIKSLEQISMLSCEKSNSSYNHTDGHSYCSSSIISMCVKTVVSDLTVEISISRVLTNNEGANRK